MNAYEIFINLMDQIYYPGYTEELAREDPVKFDFEWNVFLESYDPAN
jgi:hypothetical protein